MFTPRGGSGNFMNKSMSFHGRGTAMAPEERLLQRPRTVPNLLSTSTEVVVSVAPTRPRLTKVLVNVTVQGGVGPVQVLISPEFKVKDLITAVLKQYAKEGRRPVISGVCADDFDLHYSQFSLQSLDREEKLEELGSRNFFLCKRKTVADGGLDGSVATASCSKQAEKATKLSSPSPWVKFMSFLF